MRLLSLFLTLILASTQVAVAVTPTVGYARLTIRITTTIEPNPLNRVACLYYISDTGEDSESCWDLEGDDAPRTTTRYRELVVEGNYEVGLTVYRSDRSTMQAERRLVRVL